MVTELIAAVLVILVLVPVVGRIRRRLAGQQGLVRQPLRVGSLLFIRERGGAAGDRRACKADAFLPYLWTAFFFILFNNMLGLIRNGSCPRRAT